MKSWYAMASLAVLFTAGSNVHAETILFEDSLPGPTGFTGEQVFEQEVHGLNIHKDVFQASRFQITEKVLATEVGGHFVAKPEFGGTFFGAIIQLSESEDFPDSRDLTTPDVLATTRLVFPEPSDVVFGALDVTLDPGWYVLAFGSGLFDTSGLGAAVSTGTPTSASPFHLYFQPGGEWTGYFSFSATPSTYFVIKGIVVPEPHAIQLLACGMALMSLIRCRRQLRNYPSSLTVVYPG